jgi:hypothetical protein
MPQTQINSRQVQWLGEGQYASTRNRSVDGAVTQAIAAAFIAYGRVAVLDPATNLVSPLSGAPAAGLILVVPILVDRYGVALATALQDTAQDLGYPAGAMVEYITQGDVVMWSETGGTLGGAVHYRHTAAAAPNNKVGRIRNAADGSNTATRTTMTFAETKTTAGLIAVRVMTSVSL